MHACTCTFTLYIHCTTAIQSCIIIHVYLDSDLSTLYNIHTNYNTVVIVYTYMYIPNYGTLHTAIQSCISNM